MKIKADQRRKVKINPLSMGGVRATFVLLTAVLLIMTAPVSPVKAVNNDYFDLHHLDERTEGYFVLKDETTGQVILNTARLLHAGDQFIDNQNRSFLVTRVDQDTAWAKPDRGGNAAASSEDPGVENKGGAAIPVQKAREAVGIYHSHGAESYVPSDGVDSNDAGGGIIKVGRSFREALQNKGITVEHIQETHVPHDAGAYNRSRRTATNLVSDNLDAVFDVHRDAVPPEEYDRDIDGRDLVQIMMVVGRQNPNVSSNKFFAEELKRVADSRHPGLIKGILLAQGNYNQDLSPRAILIEIGAHTNTREQAEESVALFADVVDTYLYAQQGQTGGGGIASQGALKLLIALVLAVFIYLLISAGSWKEMREKIVSFFRREFADLSQGFKSKGKRKDDEPGS